MAGALSKDLNQQRRVPPENVEGLEMELRIKA